MKAILILDEMPRSCEECRFCSTFYYCEFLGDVDESIENGSKDLRCPLKPMPQKKYAGLNFFEWKQYKNQGWNDCINYLTGGLRDE